MKPNPYDKDGWSLVALADGRWRLIIPPSPLNDRPVAVVLTDAELDRLRFLAAHRDLSPTVDG